MAERTIPTAGHSLGPILAAIQQKADLSQEIQSLLTQLAPASISNLESAKVNELTAKLMADFKQQPQAVGQNLQAIAASPRVLAAMRADAELMKALENDQAFQYLLSQQAQPTQATDYRDQAETRGAPTLQNATTNAILRRAAFCQADAYAFLQSRSPIGLVTPEELGTQTEACLDQAAVAVEGALTAELVDSLAEKSASKKKKN